MFNNKLIATALGSALLASGATYGATIQTIEPANSLILKENVELHSRLKEPPLWDTSVVSSQEITDAYIAVSEKYGITANDLTAAGGNLQMAIQAKMPPQLLCK